MGSVSIGYLSAFLAYLYLEFTEPAYNRDGKFLISPLVSSYNILILIGAYTPVVLAFAFLIGLQMGNVILNPLKSGVSTLFVAMAWDPVVLQRDHKDLYTRMIQVYPRAQQALSPV